MELNHLGWTPQCAQALAPFAAQGLSPARIVCEYKEQYDTLGPLGMLRAGVSGALRDASGPGGFPAVGDWVALRPRPGESTATIHALLPRRSVFARKTAGNGQAPQVVAANVDTVLLVSGLDGDFNVRRIERYLTLAWESGARPVVVLNKADVCPDVDAAIAEVESVAMGVPIHALSATHHAGLDALRAYLAPGKTVALLGSSGVGKSSLINALLGRAALAVRAVREDDSRGRHTTTRRELIVLPGGGMIIDTPGMRELQLWADDEALDGAFGDVAELAAKCRFRDCRHEREPGCAVRAALASGELDPTRYESYVKLGRELAHLARKDDIRLQHAERDRWKKIHKEVRQRQRFFGR